MLAEVYTTMGLTVPAKRTAVAAGTYLAMTGESISDVEAEVLAPHADL